MRKKKSKRALADELIAMPVDIDVRVLDPRFINRQEPMTLAELLEHGEKQRRAWARRKRAARVAISHARIERMKVSRIARGGRPSGRRDGSWRQTIAAQMEVGVWYTTRELADAVGLGVEPTWTRLAEGQVKGWFDKAQNPNWDRTNGCRPRPADWWPERITWLPGHLRETKWFWRVTEAGAADAARVVALGLVPARRESASTERVTDVTAVDKAVG